eukprot:TRINITY_DN20979_c0_g1_i2.p1 TRINITY_DN20979_c0_g1~~TRINITY_DN20979_c0_g1_i2.p1  ORF type:complete len:318 (+),score=49.37 TRINITY_DN20979_c0_g1_i2:277-1230(+)
MIVSAWNDNGFEHLLHDATRLQHTEFMPGLGWLMPRKLWEGELARKWPSTHWDHWLREAKQHKGRTILYPQVPRVVHKGIRGTFMEPSTHQRYFASIGRNADNSVAWIALPPGDAPAASLDRHVAEAATQGYEERIRAALDRAQRFASVAALRDAMDGSAKTLAVWISVDPDPAPQGRKDPAFAPVAKFFGIWHEARRGAHRGLHELWWGETHILLANVHPKVGFVNGTWSQGEADRCDVAGSCDPRGGNPCCSPGGWCGASPQHCGCTGCVDYRTWSLPSYGHLLPPSAHVFRAADFDVQPPARLGPARTLRLAKA